MYWHDTSSCLCYVTAHKIQSSRADIRQNRVDPPPQKMDPKKMLENVFNCFWYSLNDILKIYQNQSTGKLSNPRWRPRWPPVGLLLMNPNSDQKSKILEERGTTPSHRGIEEGPLPTPHTARVPQFDRPPSCFCKIRALYKPVGVVLSPLRSYKEIPLSVFDPS